MELAEELMAVEGRSSVEPTVGFDLGNWCAERFPEEWQTLWAEAPSDLPLPQRLWLAYRAWGELGWREVDPFLNVLRATAADLATAQELWALACSGGERDFLIAELQYGWVLGAGLSEQDDWGINDPDLYDQVRQWLATLRLASSDSQTRLWYRLARSFPPRREARGFVLTKQQEILMRKYCRSLCLDYDELPRELRSVSAMRTYWAMQWGDKGLLGHPGPIESGTASNLA